MDKIEMTATCALAEITGMFISLCKMRGIEAELQQHCRKRGIEIVFAADAPLKQPRQRDEDEGKTTIESFLSVMQHQISARLYNVLRYYSGARYLEEVYDEKFFLRIQNAGIATYREFLRAVEKYFLMTDKTSKP